MRSREPRSRSVGTGTRSVLVGVRRVGEVRAGSIGRSARGSSVGRRKPEPEGPEARVYGEAVRSRDGLESGRAGEESRLELGDRSSAGGAALTGSGARTGSDRRTGSDLRTGSTRDRLTFRGASGRLSRTGAAGREGASRTGLERRGASVRGAGAGEDRAGEDRSGVERRSSEDPKPRLGPERAGVERPAPRAGVSLRLTFEGRESRPLRRSRSSSSPAKARAGSRSSRIRMRNVCANLIGNSLSDPHTVARILPRRARCGTKSIVLSRDTYGARTSFFTRVRRRSNIEDHTAASPGGLSPLVGAPCPRCDTPVFVQRGCGTPGRLLANLAVPVVPLGIVALSYLLVTMGVAFAGAGLAAAAGLLAVHFFAFSGGRFAVQGVSACPRCGWTRVGEELRPRDEVLRRRALGFFRSVLRSLLLALVFFLAFVARGIFTGDLPFRESSLLTALTVLALLASHLYRTYRPGDDPRSRVVWLFARRRRGGTGA